MMSHGSILFGIVTVFTRWFPTNYYVYQVMHIVMQYVSWRLWLVFFFFFLFSFFEAEGFGLPCTAWAGSGLLVKSR